MKLSTKDCRNLVINCETQEDYDEFVEFFKDLEIETKTKFDYSESNCWAMVTPSTCTVNPFEVGGTYSHMGYYLNHKYKVITWSDFKMKFMKKEKEYTAVGNYQKFTKKDLKSGDIITFRNNQIGIIFTELNGVVFNGLCGQVNLNDTNDNLFDVYDSDWDIVKVQRPKTIVQTLTKYWGEAPVIWEREETVEMTLEEVCKALGKNVKIVKE